MKVYKYNSGRYYGIDIFDYLGNHNDEVAKIKEEYSNAGFSVLIKNYQTAEEAELDLFLSFFNAKHFKKQIIVFTTSYYSIICK